jgi:hypothetical protein
MLISSFAHSQIEVGVNTLPNLGDVLDYGIFSTSYRTQGGNLSWSYSGIVPDSFEQEFYLDISGHPLQDTFPSANMLIRGAGFEAAAIRSSTEINAVGLGGELFNFFGSGSFVLSDPFLFKKVPISYGDSFTDEVDVSLTFPSSLIPGLDTVTLPIPGTTLDSLRFTITFGKTEEATAWGELELHNKSYDVLKITQQDFTSTIIELGINFFGQITWFDATTLFGGGMGMGTDLTVTHKFLTADSKESMIEFSESRIPIDTFGNTELIVTGRIKASLLTSNKDNYQPISDLNVYPNPSSGAVTIIGSNIGNEHTNIFVRDLFGRQLSRFSQDISGDAVIGDLPPGEYLIEVRTKDQRGVRKVIVK